MMTRSGATSSNGPRKKALKKIVRPKHCYIDRLPEEVKCVILSHLSLADICKMNYMSKCWSKAVERFLRYATVLSFQEPGNELCSYASSMRDWELMALLSKCMMLERIKSFYPTEISQISKNQKVLTQSNITIALTGLPHLRTMEISDLNLMSELRAKLPLIQMPIFRNTNGLFPREKTLPCQWLNCPSVIQEIELYGITLHHLPSTLKISKLHLQNVKIRNGMTRDPSRVFMPNLQSFMMNDCIWPVLDLEQTNMTLCAGLASCRHLEVLHLARSSIEGRLLKRIVEANWLRCRPFSKLKKLVLAANWALHEDDIGSLLVASHPTLEKLYIQKSLTRDMLIQALEIAGTPFPSLTSLKLGYVDELSPRESNHVSDEDEFQIGVVLDDRPCQLSDYGLKMVTKVFNNSSLTSFSVNDCPYLNSPCVWISDADTSFWECLTELTLSRCPTTNLDEFNKFLPRLRSLQILNLIGAFPSPPKGCSRVGLSAGMNIGGAGGIGAIISQPQTNPPNSLLSVPDVDLIEARELLSRGKLPESDTDDTMEFADPNEGYRYTQVHSSCTATSHRIRRSRVRCRPHEREIIGYPSAEARKKALNLKKRKEREEKERERKQKASSSALRRSRRLRDRETVEEHLAAAAEEQEDVSDDLLVSISKQRLNNDKENREGDEPNNDIVVPEEVVKKREPVSVALMASSSSGPDVCDDSDEDPKAHRCQACGRAFEEPQQPSRRLQLFEPRRKDDLLRASDLSRTKICITCIKKQCHAAKESTSTASIDSLRPSQSAQDDVNKWLIFDTTSGYARMCSYNQSRKKNNKWRLKGKALLKAKHAHRQKVKRQLIKSSAEVPHSEEFGIQITRHSRLKGKQMSRKGNAPHNANSDQTLQMDLPLTGVQNSDNRALISNGRKRKQTGLAGSEDDVQLKKAKGPATADKETHTKDPFIEPDSEQVLRVDNSTNVLTAINLTSCGLTRLSLTHAHSLVSVTAHACPVLKEMVFSTNPAVAPDVVRVTQCPKLSLPTLVAAFRNKTITCDISTSAYVRTIEYEPVDRFDREEALIEMSLLPEVNKVLVECHKLTGEDECSRLKAFYQNLLKDMTRSGNAGYKSEAEFKIYTDLHYGEEVIVSHNIPSCTTKISPQCKPAVGDCQIASAEGHQLQGCSVLCFVHPIDNK